MDEAIIAACRDAVGRALPDRARANPTIHGHGWDCVVIEADGWIFKFPRHADAEARLGAEARTLAFAAGHAVTAVPRLSLVHDAALERAGGPAMFSMHAMVAGDILTTEAFAALNEPARDRLCGDLASAYAGFHTAGLDDARAAGVPPVPVWPDGAALSAVAETWLDAAAAGLARRVLDAWAQPFEDISVFGHFDTHGWNMALDSTGTRLAGLFDFGHSGIGPLHRDLSYPAFVSVECALQVAGHYRERTGRAVDCGRILNTHAVLRLVELFDAQPSERAERVAAFRTVMADICAAGHAVPGP